MRSVGSDGGLWFTFDFSYEGLLGARNDPGIFLRDIAARLDEHGLVLDPERSIVSSGLSELTATVRVTVPVKEVNP